MLKHLLRTASFAKTFADPQDFDANKYVNVVKHMIVLTKLRNSQNVSRLVLTLQCARAITFKQFEKFKAKNVLRLLLKHRDYKLALQVIEQLNLKQYAPMVYEDWCQTMVKHSSLPESELRVRLQEKFDQLKIQIAEDQGVNLQQLQFQLRINSASVPSLAVAGRSNSQLS